MERSGEQMMNVEVAHRADAVIVTVDGEVDTLTTPRLRVAIADAFTVLDGRPLVVDLTRVTFLGSAGLSVLLESAHEAVHHRGPDTLRVVVDHQRPVVRPIELTGLDAVLTLFHDVPGALDA